LSFEKNGRRKSNGKQVIAKKTGHYMKVSNVFTYYRGEKTKITSKYVHIFLDPVHQRSHLSSLLCNAMINHWSVLHLWILNYTSSAN